MARVAPPSRVKTTSTTIGTGTVTIATAAADGFRRPQDTVTEGQSTGWMMAIVAEDGLIWEQFEGTRSGNTITRDQTLANSEGTTSPINFPPGTKEVFADAPGEWLAYHNIANDWESDQFFEAKLGIGSEKATYWQASYNSGTNTHTASMTLGNTLLKNYGKGTEEIVLNDTSAAYGPDLIVSRVRSNAGNGSQGGRIVFKQSDDTSSGSGGPILTDYASIDSFWNNFTSGADSSVSVQVMSAGTKQTKLTVSGSNGVQVRNTSLLVGKTVMGDLQTAGLESKATGQTTITADNNHPLELNRLTADGDAIRIYRGSSLVSQVTIAGTNVTWGNFHGGHSSCFPSGDEIPDYIAPGTVMVTADEEHPLLPHLPRARVSSKRCDPRVYGVFNAWLEPKDGQPDYGEFLVGGLGMASGVLCVGPVREGDLLVTSDVPGHAEAWQGSQDEPWPNMAAVLGKVTRTDLSDGSRLVRASVRAS